jgi:hypothetical protein
MPRSSDQKRDARYERRHSRVESRRHVRLGQTARDTSSFLVVLTIAKDVDPTLAASERVRKAYVRYE